MDNVLIGGPLFMLAMLTISLMLQRYKSRRK
jgi:hypothetical protein